MNNLKKAMLLAIALVMLCASIALAGCGGSKKVSVGDCTVKFTGHRWDEGWDWGMINDNAVFVVSCTVTNNGDQPVRPADHLLVTAVFEDEGHGQYHENTLFVYMPSGSEEVAPGETAEVLLWDSVDVGVKKSYYDGCRATLEWGWADDLSDINLNIPQEAYEAFEGLDEVHTLSLGRV